MKINKTVIDNISFHLNFNHLCDGLNEDQVKTIAKLAIAHLKKESHLSTKEIQSDLFLIDQAVDHVIASGKAPWMPNLEFKDKRQEKIFNLMRGEFSEEIARDKELISAVILEKNPALLKETRGLLQDVFFDMFSQMEEKKLSKQENFHMEVMIGDLLSLYPFLRPEQDEEIKIPIFIEGKWNLVSYQTDKIPLTPPWMGSPLVAYGLSPKNNLSAPPLLLFKGTTYPTDEGASLSILTDLNPGASVGSYAYSIGKKKIESWLSSHVTDENKAIIYGKSLGGAHAWRTALQFPTYVQKSMCFAAPGFSSKDLQKLNILKNEGNLPQINLFSQKNDPVQHIDLIAKNGVNYYEILGKKKYKGVLAHAHMNSTQESSIILNKKPSAKSLKRVALTSLKVLSSLTLFPLLIFPHAVISLRRKIKRVK